MTPKKVIISGRRALRTFYLIQTKHNLSRWRNSLHADYLRLQIPLIWPLPQKLESHTLLDFKVKSYDTESFERIFKQIFIDQVYFFRTKNSRPFIVDCGSHIGISVLYFKKLYPNAKILAFEPGPETFRILKTNVEKNNLKDVYLYNKALSDQEGKLMFYGDLSADSSLFGRGKGTLVNVVKLSQFIDQKVDFLKIDIEGAEKKVLNELATSGKLSMTQEMSIEFHHHFSNKEKDDLSIFLKILEDYHFGYQILGNTPLPHKKRAPNVLKILAYQK